MYVCIGFKTFFYVVRQLDSIASYLPTGLHLGFFRSWPSLFLPSSFSSVFLVLSLVSASTSVLFWVVFLLPFFEHEHGLQTANILFDNSCWPLPVGSLNVKNNFDVQLKPHFLDTINLFNYLINYEPK